MYTEVGWKLGSSLWDNIGGHCLNSCPIGVDVKASTLNIYSIWTTYLL